MELHPESQDKLSQWIKARTWNTDDLGDMNRWYAFVDAYQREHGYTIPMSALRDHIGDMIDLGGDLDERLWRVIWRRIGLAQDILEFLEYTATAIPASTPS